MSKEGIVSRVNKRVWLLSMSQYDLSLQTGLSQGHLSKILSGTVNPGTRTIGRLSDWLRGGVPVEEGSEIQKTLNRLIQLHPRKRQAIMQMMYFVEDLLNEGA